MFTKQIVDTELTTDKTRYVDRLTKPDSRSPAIPVTSATLKETDLNVITHQTQRSDSIANKESEKPAGQRDISIITDELLSCKDKFGESAYTIGKLLIEAKEAWGDHGKWIAWLRSVDFHRRTAQRFMRLAREYPNATTLSRLGFSKALTLLLLPEDERDAFIEAIHEVDGVEKCIGEMSCLEVEKVVRNHKNKRVGEEPSNIGAGNPTDSSKNHEPTESEDNLDPVTVLTGSIVHLDRLINSVLENRMKQADNPDYDQIISIIHKFCSETLQKLPPVTPANGD